MIIVRAERVEDYGVIAELNREAFGQDNEANLIARIRQSPDFDPALSLVALDADHVVGHILFSPVQIETTAGVQPALALAPMAVRPALQGRGVGSQLVRAGLEACRQQNHEIVIVVGHPDYYPRFGFAPAEPLGLRAPFPVPEEAFMALALVPGALDGLSGVVRYPPWFEGA
jgi:putative acetyltransferase